KTTCADCCRLYIPPVWTWVGPTCVPLNQYVIVVGWVSGAVNKAKAIAGVENASSTLLAVPLQTPGWHEPLPPRMLNVAVIGVRTGVGVQFTGPLQVVRVNADDKVCEPEKPAKLM